MGIRIFTMSTTPPISPGGDPAALGPQNQSTTQSAATQDLARQLQVIADVHATRLQALETAMEERRNQLLLANGQNATPEGQSASGSSSAGRDFIWEQVGNPRAPTGGSPSTGSGAATTDSTTARQPPQPPPNTSGLFNGTVLESPHSWERRRMEQQAEQAALNEAAREADIQAIIRSRVAAEVAEAMRQQAESMQSPARQSSGGSWKEVDPNSFIKQELKRMQTKLKQEQAARAQLQEMITAAGVDDEGKLRRKDDDTYATPVYQQVHTRTPIAEERMRKLLGSPPLPAYNKDGDRYAIETGPMPHDPTGRMPIPKWDGSDIATKIKPWLEDL